MATFPYGGQDIELLADPNKWLMAEAAVIKKATGARGISEIGDLIKEMDPDALTAMAMISIKRVTGVMPAFNDVANSFSLGDFVGAIDSKDDTEDPTEPAATPEMTT